ncbi:MAG TPA: M50 family metallopeptidase [Candidatus Limnocylindria bacterium]
MNLFSDVRTLLLFLVTLTVIIAVHEFGHYITARLLGMKVLEFAFGFPPRLLAVRKGGIEYSVNALPVGGFVRILGQEDFAIRQTGEGEPGSFTSKPWWAQAVVLAAGVFMNVALALVVLTGSFAFGGPVPTGEVRVVEVKPGSPAEEAGIRAEDLVREVDGQRIADSQELVRYTRAHRGQILTLVLQRDGQQLPPIQIEARRRPPEGEGPLGIVLIDATAPMRGGLPQALANAWTLTGDILQQIAALPGQLLGATDAPADGAPQIGGPIEILRVTGEVSRFGFAAILRLIGVLSINLAVLNIIPFPGLDGGRLFFVLVGGIFHKRLSPQVEAAIHAVGLLLLVGLMILVTVSDIRRVIGG